MYHYMKFYKNLIEEINIYIIYIYISFLFYIIFEFPKYSPRKTTLVYPTQPPHVNDVWTQGISIDGTDLGGIPGFPASALTSKHSTVK